MKKEISIETYNKFVEALRDKGIKCRVSFMKDFEVTVECGWNYPDKMFDKVYDQAEKLEIQDNLCVCADQSGGNVITSDRLNGGPQPHHKW